MTDKQLVVEYLNGHTRYYPLNPNRGWTKDITGCCIVIKGFARIPLCNVAAYYIENIPQPAPANATEPIEERLRAYAHQLNDIDNMLVGAGIAGPGGADGVHDLIRAYAIASNQRTAVYRLMSLHSQYVPTDRLQEVYDGEGDEIDPGTRTKLAAALVSWLSEQVKLHNLHETGNSHAWDIVHGIHLAISFLNGSNPTLPIEPNYEATTPLADARVLLAQAAELLTAAHGRMTEDPPIWHGAVDSWLELHDAHLAGARLIDMNQGTVHEDADPGRPAEMLDPAAADEAKTAAWWDEEAAEKAAKDPAEHTDAPKLTTANAATYFVDVTFDPAETAAVQALHSPAAGLAMGAADQI